MTETLEQLKQANIDYLKTNYYELICLGVLAIGDRERLEVIERSGNEQDTYN